MHKRNGNLCIYVKIKIKNNDQKFRYYYKTL